MKKVYFVTTLMIFILVAFSTLILAESDLKIIYPIEDSIIGGHYRYANFNYQEVAYDFLNDELYYGFGNEFRYNDRTSFGLGYSYWIDDSIEGYLYKKGSEINLYYDKGSESNFELGLFKGDVGEEFSEEVKTGYVNLKYNKRLFGKWGDRADLNLDITSGRDENSDNYYISNLSVPMRYKGFSFHSRLGYIEESPLIRPYYDLGEYVPGYANYYSSNNSQERYAKIGNRVVSIAIEKEIAIFPYKARSYPFLSLLNCIVSANAGSLLDKDERLKDFEINSSIGGGLSLNLGGGSLRLERFITDQKETKTTFNFKANY